MKGHKKSKVKKHRGNPHGNAPGTAGRSNRNLNSDDRLRQESGIGISESERLKQ